MLFEYHLKGLPHNLITIKMVTELIDVAANLTHQDFDRDRQEVIKRAQAVGVSQLIVVAASIEESHAAVALAHQFHPRLFATAGVHPHNARAFGGASSAAIAAVATNDAVVAIGECGLDFNRNYSSSDSQLYAFEAQLELAARLRLPVFMHQRDAHERFYKLVSQYRAELVAAVVHCFTDHAEALAAYLALDLHISISGWICDPQRGKHLHDLVSRIPSSRLMLETDAPYLLPKTLSPKPRHRRNEPMYLPQVLATVAACGDQDITQLGASTTATARTFFNLPLPSTPLAAEEG